LRYTPGAQACPHHVTQLKVHAIGVLLHPLVVVLVVLINWKRKNKRYIVVSDGAWA
jgi:hypothetical protein